MFKVCKIEDIFICGEKYKELANKKIALETLCLYPAICLEENTSTRKYVNNFFEKNNVEYVPKYELATSDLIVDFTKRNFGIGCVVDKFAIDSLKDKEIYQIKTKEKIEQRNICIIKKEKTISKASSVLLEFMKDNKTL